MRERYLGWLQEELNKIEGFQVDQICVLDQYPLYISRKVLSVLMHNACVGQSEGPRLLAKECIKSIDVNWLEKHFLEVADLSIDYSDDWDYRRLLELVTDTVPKLLSDVIERGIHSSNEEVREAAQDFSEPS